MGHGRPSLKAFSVITDCFSVRQGNYLLYVYFLCSEILEQGGGDGESKPSKGKGLSWPPFCTNVSGSHDLLILHSKFMNSLYKIMCL